jgi:hypothetical protein
LTLQAEVLPEFVVRAEVVVFVRAEDAQKAFAAAESALHVAEINGLKRGTCSVGKPRRITP